MKVPLPSFEGSRASVSMGCFSGTIRLMADWLILLLLRLAGKAGLIAIGQHVS